jgi:four helix bundle protein
MISSCKDLVVWQKSMTLVKAVYLATQSFPDTERYGLTAQIRRSAISIPSNIAEGQARDSSAEFHRFLSIAYGSLAELETQMLIAESLGYIDKAGTQAILAPVSEIGKMMNVLMEKIANKRPNH